MYIFRRQFISTSLLCLFSGVLCQNVKSGNILRQIGDKFLRGTLIRIDTDSSNSEIDHTLTKSGSLIIHSENSYSIDNQTKLNFEENYKYIPQHGYFQSTVLIHVVSGEDTPKNIFQSLENLHLAIDLEVDMVIFHSEVQTDIKNLLLNADISTKIKNKIGISSQTGNPIHYKVCPFCHNGNPLLIETSVTTGETPELFPDFLTTFSGKIFEVASPTLVHTSFEVREIPEGSGNWVGTRGVSHFAFEVLKYKYNFTGHHFPSWEGGTGRRLKNGTWTGTVGDILRGKADIGQVSGHVYSRSKLVAFSPPVTYIWLTFTTSQPMLMYTWKSVYQPFNPLMWLLILLSILLYGIITFLFYSKSKSSLVQPFSHTINYLYRTFMEQDANLYEIPRNIHSIRTFSTFWLIFVLLIDTAYRSKLIAFLLDPPVEILPNSFTELASMPSFRAVLYYIHGAAYTLLKNSKNPTFRTIWDRLELEENDELCFRKVVTEPHVSCLSWNTVADYVQHKSISDKTPVVRAPEITSFISLGLVYRKGAIFKEKIDIILARAFDHGLHKKWLDFDRMFIRKERVQKERDSNYKEDTSNYLPIYDDQDRGMVKLDNLKGTFGVLVVGLCLSTCVSLVEMLATCIKLKGVKMLDLKSKIDLYSKNIKAEENSKDIEIPLTMVKETLVKVAP